MSMEYRMRRTLPDRKILRRTPTPEPRTHHRHLLRRHHPRRRRPLAGDVDAIGQTLRAGARGIIVGRNIWQRERSEGERALKEIGTLTRGVGFTS
ncbi:hypothetical protein [Rhodococcus sp. NPDC057529]|uniref:hypothetical protein n=1 Tax=Rhodococcus sp. NPDC057529 TaxID=3346158 RepID=UPI00366D41F1